MNWTKCLKACSYTAFLKSTACKYRNEVQMYSRSEFLSLGNILANGKKLDSKIMKTSSQTHMQERPLTLLTTSSTGDHFHSENSGFSEPSPSRLISLSFPVNLNRNLEQEKHSRVNDKSGHAGWNQQTECLWPHWKIDAFAAGWRWRFSKMHFLRILVYNGLLTIKLIHVVDICGWLMA